eukprot:6199494-Pleurochrysis_carterae.AAC.4
MDLGGRMRRARLADERGLAVGAPAQWRRALDQCTRTRPIGETRSQLKDMLTPTRMALRSPGQMPLLCQQGQPSAKSHIPHIVSSNLALDEHTSDAGIRKQSDQRASTW